MNKLRATSIMQPLILQNDQIKLRNKTRSEWATPHSVGDSWENGEKSIFYHIVW